MRVKTDINSIDQLPLMLEQERMPLNLYDFEDECKALSLDALSLHPRVESLYSSHLHYCNFFCLSGRSFEQNLETNIKMLVGYRQDIQNEVKRMGRAWIFRESSSGKESPKRWTAFSSR